MLRSRCLGRRRRWSRRLIRSSRLGLCAGLCSRRWLRRGRSRFASYLRQIFLRQFHQFSESPLFGSALKLLPHLFNSCRRNWRSVVSEIRTLVRQNRGQLFIGVLALPSLHGVVHTLPGYLHRSLKAFQHDRDQPIVCRSIHEFGSGDWRILPLHAQTIRLVAGDTVGREQVFADHFRIRWSSSASNGPVLWLIVENFRAESAAEREQVGASPENGQTDQTHHPAGQRRIAHLRPWEFTAERAPPGAGLKSLLMEFAPF